MNRVQYTYVRRARRLAIRLPLKRRLPDGVTFYAGSQFWCLSPKHCLYVLGVANKWSSLFQRSLIPDELFFQTILMNSKFFAELINEQGTHTRWEKNAASPSLLRIKDLPELMRSPSYFARKFDLDQDQQIMDVLDQSQADFGAVENTGHEI
jgi:hypothetical protein